MPSFTPLAKKFLARSAEQESLPGIDVPKKIARKKEKQSKKNGRWAVVIIFLTTTLASLFFYLKTEAPVIWEKITGPAVISTLPEETNLDPEEVLAEIEQLTQGLRGEYGVYVYRLESGESYGIKENQVFTAASLIKLPVMLAIYREAETGNLNLKDYQDKLEAMGKRSDNAAFNRVVVDLGEESIQAVIDSLGMKNTSFTKNQTTPADIGRFFRRLYQDRLITSEHREEFFDFLTDTTNETRIPAGIPDEIRVAHKIGTETGVFADAGIIFGQKPFLLVIMSDNARESEVTEVLPKIAKAVWEFEVEFDRIIKKY
jgi:beta-lactamase class A